MFDHLSQKSSRRLSRQKILIVKLQYVGDTMGVVPVVATLKRNAPELTVDVLIHAECAQLIAHHTDIRKVWIYDRSQVKKNFFSSIAYHLPLIRALRREKYDIVIALTQGDRAFFLSRATGAPLRVTYDIHTLLTSITMNAFARHSTHRHFIEIDMDMLRYFEIENRDIRLMLPFPEDVRRKARSRLAADDHPSALRVAIHPGARKKMKQWRADRFGQIASKLREHYGASIILLGGSGEEGLLDIIENEMGFPAVLKSCSLSLLDMAAVFSECHLFIGNDSGPGHIAAAVGCPTLSLFGPSLPIIFRPYIASGEVIFKNLDCCGCRQEEYLCVRPESTCMDMIEVDEVWERVVMMLSKMNPTDGLNNAPVERDARDGARQIQQLSGS